MEEQIMKKIFISIAAIAAIVSCVEEKGLDLQPQQPVGNQVTIKAVAAETKTALADYGTSIVWENGDEISLIFDYGTHKSSVICTTELDTPNSTAEFSGDLTDIEPAKVAENVNLLYPADAFDNSQSKITFKVPAEQDGTVGSGENLSYALLTKTEIAGGSAEAQFTNALSLFKITVPEGVKTVTLTANRHLSGTGTYKFNEAGELVLNSTDQGSSNNTVVLNSESGLDAARTYDILVYPGAVTSLTLELVGVDGASYSKTLKHDDNSVYMTLEAGKYYSLKMANLFQWNTETALYASPLGGELKIKTSTTADFNYDVTITNADGTGTPDWISTTPPAKGFHQDVIVLYVDQNTSGETRTAKVTVSYGDEKSQVFTVTQSSAFMDFVYTEENPIEWEETFGLFSDSELNIPVDSDPNTNEIEPLTYKNVFRIELSDDFSKGTYLIDGLFVMRHTTNGLVGGKYYANYKDNQLLVFARDNATQSYYFSDEIIAITYNEQEQTFSCSNALQFNAFGAMNSDYSADGYIGNYEVHHYEAPDTGEGINVIGTYQESYTLTNCYTKNNLGLKITISDDPSKGDVMVTNIFGNVPTGMYATVTENTITTVESAYINNLNGKTAIGSLTLTVGEIDGNVVVTIPDQTLFGRMALSNYTATKK